MDFRIDGPMLDLGACGVLAQEIVAFPVLRRSDRSRNKTATAVRTDVAQYAIHTRRAKRALVGADARLKRVRWQRPVAVLASRSEFKHGVFSLIANVLSESRNSPRPSQPNG